MSKPDTTPPSVREILIYAIGMAALYDTTAESVQKLTDEATSQIEALILDARIDERNEVALDNYRGQTFSGSTDYKGKFDKFVLNNEKYLATLKTELGEGK